AFERAGRSHVECEIRAGSFREARLHAASCNARSGEPRKPEDRRRAVLMALEDDEVREGSDARVAKHGGGSGPLVGWIRKMLKEREEQRKRDEEEEKNREEQRRRAEEESKEEEGKEDESDEENTQDEEEREEQHKEDDEEKADTWTRLYRSLRKADRFAQ